MALRLILFATILCLVQLWQSDAAAVVEHNDWEGLKQDLFNTDYSIVDFFASCMGWENQNQWLGRKIIIEKNGCSYCNILAPKYEKAAETISKGTLKDKIKLIKVKCDDKESGRKICTANNIQGFPTIIAYKKGIKFDQYKGDRTPEAMVKYAEDIVKTGKPQYADKHVDDQQICLAKDFKKYVGHKS